MTKNDESPTLPDFYTNLCLGSKQI